ncbi:MAG: FAD-dependent oxidoreductase, partial [Clostridiales bacterium]
MSGKYDIAILGGGPGGYVAAIRSAQLGFKSVIIDKDNLGGICLNWGCIPTKALLKNADLYEKIKNAGQFGITVENCSFDFSKIIKRSRDVADRLARNVEYLMKKNKIDRIRGFGKLANEKVLEVFDQSGNKTETIEASKIIIATGARSRTIKQIPVDGEKIITSTEAMVLKDVPTEMIIIGAGAIGIEFAYFYSVLGTKVTVVEALNSILPIEDKEISEALAKELKKKGITIHTRSIVEKAEIKGNRVEVTLNSDGKTSVISADIALNAIGVTGNVEGFGLEKLGIELFKNHIKVDKRTYQTNIKDIFAIGDVIGPPWLAHVASA